MNREAVIDILYANSEQDQVSGGHIIYENAYLQIAEELLKSLVSKDGSYSKRELHERIIRLTTEIIIHRPERKIVKRWVKNYEQWSKDWLDTHD